MTWFTSDTHWGHVAVLRYCDRPFATVEEMDEAMVRRWNARVRPDDTVFHLGDFGLFMNPADLLALRSRLHGKIVLVRGNHDRAKLCRRVAGAFEGIHDYLEWKCEGRLYVLCHYPFLSWKNSGHGGWHLHGHSHQKSPRAPGRLDVGVDGWDYAPLSLEEVNRHLDAMKASLSEERAP